MEQYQDIWVKGKLIKKGVREVESRYNIIKAEASKFNRPFTVLDIGSNLGYFAVRLTEDFPECTVVSLEGLYGKWLQDILKQNDSKRIILLNKTFSLGDLGLLADSEHFDIVLAMSVIHHIKGEFKNVLETVRQLGEVKIVEIATEDNACGQKSVKSGFIPDDAKIIGYGESHLNGPKRPIFYMYDKKTKLNTTYINSERENPKEHHIESNYNAKVFTKEKEDGYDWHRGINLKTYLYFDGIYPDRNKVSEMIHLRKPLIKHGDLKSHNVILQGDDVQYIDFLEKDGAVYDDEETFAEILLEINKEKQERK